MSQMPYMNSRSPPPLQHPKPTHPAYPPPEPPRTPGASTNSSPYSQAARISQDSTYMRYSSPPVDAAPRSTSDASSAAYASSSGINPTPYASSGAALGGASNRGSGPAPGTGAGGGYAGQHGVQGYGAGGQPSYGGGGWPGMGMGMGMGMNDATAQMGVQFGKSAVAAGQDYVEKNFTRYLPLQLIKTSFSVTNRYVLNKLRLLLFPWRHKPWARQVRRVEGGNMEGWQPPRDDINAPDLYIPTMALVTYTLLCGLSSGLKSRFHPEVLGASFFSAMVVVIAEFCFIKLGCYLLDVRGGGASGVELIGYGGYKFVGIITTIIAGFLKLGTLASGAVFVYTFAANFFFLLRSLKYVLLPDPATTGAPTLSHAQRSRRIQFLFVLAASQLLWMGWLSRV